jgi:hypothetical protein
LRPPLDLGLAVGTMDGSAPRRTGMPLRRSPHDDRGRCLSTSRLHRAALSMPVRASARWFRYRRNF